MKVFLLLIYHCYESSATYIHTFVLQGKCGNILLQCYLRRQQGKMKHQIVVELKLVSGCWKPV
jgi:hypothetical protein